MITALLFVFGFGFSPYGEIVVPPQPPVVEEVRPTPGIYYKRELAKRRGELKEEKKPVYVIPEPESVEEVFTLPEPVRVKYKPLDPAGMALVRAGFDALALLDAQRMAREVARQEARARADEEALILLAVLAAMPKL